MGQKPTWLCRKPCFVHYNRKHRFVIANRKPVKGRFMLANTSLKILVLLVTSSRRSSKPCFWRTAFTHSGVARGEGPVHKLYSQLELLLFPSIKQQTLLADSISLRSHARELIDPVAASPRQGDGDDFSHQVMRALGSIFSLLVKLSQPLQQWLRSIPLT